MWERWNCGDSNRLTEEDAGRCQRWKGRRKKIKKVRVKQRGATGENWWIYGPGTFMVHGTHAYLMIFIVCVYGFMSRRRGSSLILGLSLLGPPFSLIWVAPSLFPGKIETEAGGECIDGHIDRKSPLPWSNQGNAAAVFKRNHKKIVYHFW